MEIENIYVPADKQNDREGFYIRYLSDCVDRGVLTEEEAEDIINNKQWNRVEQMIDWGDSREEDYERADEMEKGDKGSL